MRAVQGIFAGLGALILAVAVIVGLIYLTGTLSMFTAPFRGEVDKTEQIQADGDYRIAAYDEFFDLCSAIQSKNDQIENLQAVKAASSGEEKRNMTMAVVAQENIKSELVRDYNSKAAAEGTRGQFRDSELPYVIDEEDREVQCGSA